MSAFLLQIIVFGAFPALMAFAACSDLVSMTIANWLQIACIVLFFVVAVLGGFALGDLAYHVMAFSLILLLAFLCFAFGWIGGGDAKLAACTALWFGMTPQLYNYLLVSAYLGGALTLLILYGRTLSLPDSLARKTWIVRLHDQKQGIPYGIALASAALIVYPDTAVFALALK